MSPTDRIFQNQQKSGTLRSFNSITQDNSFTKPGSIVFPKNRGEDIFTQILYNRSERHCFPSHIYHPFSRHIQTTHIHTTQRTHYTATPLLYSSNHRFTPVSASLKDISFLTFLGGNMMVLTNTTAKKEGNIAPLRQCDSSYTIYHVLQTVTVLKGPIM